MRQNWTVGLIRKQISDSPHPSPLYASWCPEGACGFVRLTIFPSIAQGFNKTLSMYSTRTTSKRFPTLLILLLITAHSFLINGYFYSSRFLTVATYVDPIVAECDPTLFRNSLYVQSLEEKNARLSLLHDLSTYIFCDADLETISLVQWSICLFLTLCALFYLGKTVTGSDSAGYGTALLFNTALNTWTLGSPAIYINFFHHGIQWATVLNILSLTLMLKKRYLLAFFFMGVAWNFHPMSVVFLFLLFFPFWIRHIKEFGIKTLGASAACFVIPALPLLIKSFRYLDMEWHYGPEWITTVKWTAWYTVFASTWPARSFVKTGLFFLLFLMGLSTLHRREAKKDIILFVTTIGVLCAIAIACADLYPVPFIMKLSLWRTSWMYVILALPCITSLFVSLWDKSLLKRFVIIVTFILLTGCIHSFPYYYLIPLDIFIFLFLYRPALERRYQWMYNHSSPVFLLLLALCMAYQAFFDRGFKPTAVGLTLVFLFLLLLRFRDKHSSALTSARALGTIGAGLFFLGVLDTGVLLHRGGPEIYYHGFVQGRRDPWANLQLYAGANSAKDDLFIIPPYLNDFGLYSRRATLSDWAEGSNGLYLDNVFAKQWLERMHDLGWNIMGGEVSGYNGLSTEQITAAAQKYKAAYVVTEKPKQFALPRVYENSHYILYRTPGT